MADGRTSFIGFRHAAWDVPWWVNPNRAEGRYHRAHEQPTQYLCLHPLGVAAEFLRWHGPAVVDDIDTVKLRLWSARVPCDGVVAIGFDTAATHGIAPAELVSDDYKATQGLADRLRDDGVQGIVVPSAALPGTDNLVLFGARTASSFLGTPPDPDQQLRTAHTAEQSQPPAEAVPFVRWRGTEHQGLTHWKSTGKPYRFIDPPL